VEPSGTSVLVDLPVGGIDDEAAGAEADRGG
jgi:hypothetical protein